MNLPATIGALVATGGITAMVLLIIRDRQPSGPDYGVAVFAEDPGHEDNGPVVGCECEDCADEAMDSYLEARAEGNGVMPPPDDQTPALVLPKIHHACFDALCDREPSKICPECVPVLEGVRPAVVNRG